MKNKILCAAAAILTLLFVISLAAAQADDAGNIFINDSTPAQQTVERDLYWAGSSRGFNGYQIGKSLITAGRDITVTDSEVGGSLRAAGYSITLNGVDVTDNITAAGYDLQLAGVTAAGVYLVGNSVYFDGTADCVKLAANTVTLGGEIRGNADVYADNIVLGDDLQVEGTLSVFSNTEPALPSGAKVGQFVFKESATVDEAEPAAAEVVKTKSSNGFGRFIKGLLGTLLLAALMCLLLGAEEVKKSGEMLFARPWPMLGTGFAGLFVIPGIILILLFIGIGLPSAGLLALLFAIVCIYSLTYAGVTIAQTLLPKFTDNKTLNNVWVRSLIGALVFWLLRKIPVIGTILQAAALIYTLGYFIQTVFLRLRGSMPGAETKSRLSEVRKNDVLQSVAAAEPEEPDAPVFDAAAENDEAEVILSSLSDTAPEAEAPAEASSEPETDAGPENAE